MLAISRRGALGLHDQRRGVRGVQGPLLMACVLCIRRIHQREHGRKHRARGPVAPRKQRARQSTQGHAPARIVGEAAEEARRDAQDASPLLPSACAVPPPPLTTCLAPPPLFHSSVNARAERKQAAHLQPCPHLPQLHCLRSALHLTQAQSSRKSMRGSRLSAFTCKSLCGRYGTSMHGGC